MKGLWKVEHHPMDGRNNINGGNKSKQMGVLKRLNVASLNTHLICVLCSGYYVEATAIIECLHTFCRSCIIKYLQSNNFCPICDVQIHQAKPWSSLRPDKILQDLVYKLVPGLYQNEMQRRRRFYSHLEKETEDGESEERGFLPHGARFFSLDDSISLSLEYYDGPQEENERKDSVLKEVVEDGIISDKTQSAEKPKRYLQCPAAVTVRHLKKFLRMKYGIGLDCWVDIIYNDECLPEDFSLIDVAYTFTWKRTSPMRFSYQIYSKTCVKTLKSEKNFQTPRVDESEAKKPKQQTSLEQQKQNEYLGNFNLNPTNAGFCKSQTYTKNKTNSNCNNNNNVLKNNNTLDEKNIKKDDYVFKDFQESEDGSRDKMFHSSEESNISGLRILEESLKGNSEDSQQSVIIEEKPSKKCTPMPSFEEEEAVDSFAVEKLLRSKHKLESKKVKRKFEEIHKEKRRKSAGHADDYEEIKKKCSAGKRRKSMADEFSMKRENDEKNLDFSIRNEEKEVGSFGNLKNEALRKVFVTKDKPEINIKKKDGEVRRKKRKKSKHHEGEVKKHKPEIIATSPSIMSFAKNALKLKVKLTSGKPTIQTDNEDEKKTINGKEKGNEDCSKDIKKHEETDAKKSLTDKERLLHLRAVRHKNVINKNNPKDYINAPPSLTISKVDSSEQQPIKSTLVESRPSLEIMLVNPTDKSKVKKVELNPELRTNSDSMELESSSKEIHKCPEVVDSFGVLDLSEKSTRTKENSSNSTSPKEISDTVERCRKSTHQSILQIAQTLVNRKLSPILPEIHRRSPFNSAVDSSATAAAMRNLKTLSDTAVNILMAAQSKNFPCIAESQKQTFASIPSSIHKPIISSNSTKALKDCENGSGLKIPMFPISRDRPNPIPPVPNLHEIYPRGRGGRSMTFSKPSLSSIKPGQNQTVRQIPNPFVVLNRQTNQNQNLTKPIPPPGKPAFPTENGDNLEKQKINSIPPLQSIKAKPTLPKLEDLTEGSKNGSTEFKDIVPKILNNNTKSVQNSSESNFLITKKDVEEKKVNTKMNNNTTSMRKIENMTKNIETVAAGLTARAVSNAMIDAK